MVPEQFFYLTMDGGFTAFFEALIDEIRNGLFLFSSPWDMFISALDVAVTTFAIYYILRLISDTRAWQLLKGLLWLFFFTLIAGWLGLGTISFVLVNSVSVLALGLVVIFQPELRRALESVGRNSSWLFTARDEETDGVKLVHNIIEAIVVACEKMAAEKTGALIILERKTRLGDLIESGTAVVLDAELTSATLRQIFYKNSPMHDGAVMIRKGRIFASRVHVPLSDSYQLRREMGTRHRAAIGASEIGDAIAIVCSEEHGTISIAVHGRLYTLDNADALRTILHRLLGSREALDDQTLPRRLRKVLRFDRMQVINKEKNEENANVSSSTKAALDSIHASAEEGNENVNISGVEITSKPHRSRILLIVLAFVASLFLSLYVRVTTNPITNRVFTVPIQTVGLDVLDQYQLDYFKAENQVTVTIRGREKTLRDLVNNQIDATIDFSQIREAGTVSLPVNISIDNISNLAYTVTWRNPDSVVVNIYQEETIPPTSGNEFPIPSSTGGN